MPIRFTVTPERVREFTKLTGDVSSLHTDAGFARKSLYGENVAHGMLPIMGLALAPALRRPGQQARLERLAATFSSPVFLNDELDLSLDGEKTDDKGERAEGSFSIRRKGSSALVTQGSLAWSFKPMPETRTVSSPADRIDPPSSLLPDPPQERSLALEQIESRDRAGFRAALHTSHLACLVDMLRQASPTAVQGEPSLRGLATQVDLRPFLLASLSSTMVGVLLPGKTATYLGLNLAFPEAPALEQTLEVEAQVAHLSASTRTIVERLSVRSQGPDPQTFATGKLNVRVNSPHARMPTSSELAKSQAKGLGLKDKVVLVTGASRGLGETMAKLFALQGCRVAVNYNQGAEDAARVVEDIESAGGLAKAFQADVSRKEAVDAMVAAIADAFGPVDVLINNAVRKILPEDFLSIAWERLQADLDVALKGAFLCSQAVLPSMVGRRRGKIVNIGTQATDVAPPRQASYVASKSALNGLTRSLSTEFAVHNIQVNMVCPSMADTDLTSGVSSMVRDRIVADTPMNRLPAPEEIANAALMLASDLASFTTGQRFMVTGGQPPCL